MANTENERQYRVVDQMMTMHSVLRDVYRRRGRVLNLSVLAFAVVLNAFVFANAGVLDWLFGQDSQAATTGLGIAAVGLLVLSIIEYRVDWQGRSRSHGEALERLGRLKATYRDAYAEPDGETEELQAALSREYARTMEDLPEIPEKWFPCLKSRHCFKRRISQEIDRNPEAPVWLLSLRLRCHGIRRALRRRKNTG